MEYFQGCHSEWNLGNPGGWDYQRLTQTIGKTVWQKFNKIHNFDLDCEFTYLPGPVRIALKPRLISSSQIAALRRYGQKLWDDCLTLEKMRNETQQKISGC